MWDEDKSEDDGFKKLTAQQVALLRPAHHRLAVWRMLSWQAVVGGVLTVVVWGSVATPGALVSAVYGALCVLIPSAMFALGLLWRGPVRVPAALLMRFFTWEAVKLLVTIGMLLVAPLLVVPLSWPVFLASFVVTMKAYWFALCPLSLDGVKKKFGNW